MRSRRRSSYNPFNRVSLQSQPEDVSYIIETQRWFDAIINYIAACSKSNVKVTLAKFLIKLLLKFYTLYDVTAIWRRPVKPPNCVDLLRLEIRDWRTTNLKFNQFYYNLNAMSYIRACTRTNIENLEAAEGCIVLNFPFRRCIPSCVRCSKSRERDALRI